MTFLVILELDAQAAARHRMILVAAYTDDLAVGDIEYHRAGIGTIVRTATKGLGGFRIELCCHVTPPLTQRYLKRGSTAYLRQPAIVFCFYLPGSREYQYTPTIPRFCAKDKLSRPGGGASAARMVFGMQLLEALAGNVGIDLGGGNVAVAEQHLHDTQVGAVVEQVRGEGMAQYVW